MPSETTWVDRPELLETTVRKVEQEHSARLLMDKSLLRLYYQRPVTAIKDPLRPYMELSTFETLQQLGFNLSREVADASASQICLPLHATVQPLGVDFETYRSVGLLNRLIDGVFDSMDFLDIATQAYRDGCNTSIGPIKWFLDQETQEIRCERVNPLDVFWHYDEGDDPVHLYTVSQVPRSTLRARYPAKAGGIDGLPSYRQPSIVGVDPPGIRGGDSVRVSEGWRRKLGADAGRHVIVSGDLVLDDEEWAYDFHPIVSFRWSRDFRGYGGVSLSRILAPYHIWSNQLVRQVYDSLKGAVPWLLTHEDSMVDEVSDLAYQKVTWTGPSKPEIVAPNPVSPQVIQEISALRERAFAEAGVSAQVASGLRPAGLNSAPAQREWIDIVSIRSRLQQRAWEKLWTDSARCVVGLAAVAYRTKPARIKAPGSDLIEQIKWSKINLKEDQYRIKFALASGLSQTISGRLEQLQLLKDAGAIDTSDLIRHLDLPDMTGLTGRVNAPRDLAERQISEALTNGKFIMPSAMQGPGLQSLVDIGSAEYQRAMMSGVYPAANMEILRRLILAAKARLAPAPPTPAAPPLEPAGIPAPAPGNGVPALPPIAAPLPPPPTA